MGPRGTYTMIKLGNAGLVSGTVKPFACSKLQLPSLPYQVMTEAVVLLFPDEPEARLFIDVPGGIQHAIGSQSDLFVARLPREAYTFRY